MKMKPFSLVLVFTLPPLAMGENTATEMNLLRGRLEKQMTEIMAIDAEIQSLSNRLGREGSPLPRREPPRPAPEPAPLPLALEPTPTPAPVPSPAPPPNPPVEVRPAVPVNEPAAVSEPTPPIPVPAPPPLSVPDVAHNTRPTPVTPPAQPVAPVPPTPPVVAVNPPAPPPPLPVKPAPPVVRSPDPGAPPAANANEVTVKAGDTLSAIARRNKTTVAELMKLNPGLVPEKLQVGQKIKLKASAAGNVAITPAGSSNPQSTTSSAPSTPGSYVVQGGDTMHSIARRVGTTVDNLCRLNGIVNPSAIQIGMKLKLPDGTRIAEPSPSTSPVVPVKPRPPTPGTHIVKPGETLSSISRQTNTPIDELRKVNNLKDDTIHPGQSLKVRRGTGGGGAAPAPGNSGASARPAAPPPADAQGVEMAEYTVGLGDSIFSISKRYFLSREEVAAMNSLAVDAPLKAGQKLRLPASALIAAHLAESESQGN